MSGFSKAVNFCLSKLGAETKAAKSSYTASLFTCGLNPSKSAPPSPPGDPHSCFTWLSVPNVDVIEFPATPNISASSDYMFPVF